MLATTTTSLTAFYPARPGWAGNRKIFTHSHHVCGDYTPPPPQPFSGPFSGTIWVSRCQKRTSGLYGARED